MTPMIMNRHAVPCYYQSMGKGFIPPAMFTHAMGDVDPAKRRGRWMQNRNGNGFSVARFNHQIMLHNRYQSPRKNAATPASILVVVT